MKISIITATLNSEKTIEDTILSVFNQTFRDIEHLIIDGGSIDKTLEIVKKYPQRISKIISEPDIGVYDAMNKGIKLADGEIIGFLNSDDVYFDNNVIEAVVGVFLENNIDCLWGDLVYVSKDNLKKVVRYWKSSEYRDGLFGAGWVPPHPTFFVKKEIYKKYGGFNLDFKIAADYELMFRLLKKHKIKGKYISKPLIKMRTGGLAHQPKNVAKGNMECIKTWEINGFKMPFYTPALRTIRRVCQILIKRKYFA
ncbi:MAG: glycosyltransferase family 2 protein [Patescibacteria group bacterium]